MVEGEDVGGQGATGSDGQAFGRTSPSPLGETENPCNVWSRGRTGLSVFKAPHF